jgi:hypothetical protein
LKLELIALMIDFGEFGWGENDRACHFAALLFG